MRHSVRNPWRTEVKVVVHKDIFTPLYIAFENFPKNGIDIDVTFYKTSGDIKKVCIKLKYLGVFVYLMNNITNTDVVQKFRKMFKCGSRGEICVTDEKPAMITYCYRTNMLALRVHYTITNQYGVILSY